MLYDNLTTIHYCVLVGAVEVIVVVDSSSSRGKYFYLFPWRLTPSANHLLRAKNAGA